MSTESRAARRARGAFFTPIPLVDFIVERSLDAWFSNHDVVWHDEGYPLIRILDPSAGDGRFLTSACEYIFQRSMRHNSTGQMDESALRSAIVSKCLVAVERDRGYAEQIGVRLGANMEVHCEEALLSGVIGDESVDVVVGNPPYMRSISLGTYDEELRARLRGTYIATSCGEWDLYAAFLEQGFRWLRTGGELGFVLPSRWWTSQWAAPLRSFLCRQGWMRALVDFGATQLFDGATVYASICFATKSSLFQDKPLVEIARYKKKWRLGSLTSQELGGETPWRLTFGQQRTSFQALCKRGPVLGDVACIVKGAGTNADSVYVIASRDIDVERELLRPLLRGRDIVAYGEPPEWPQILVPYNKVGQLLPPDEMRQRYPKSFVYLSAYRDVLEARERGRFVGPTFYQFGRPQNMAFHGLDQPKLVIPDVTKSGRCLIDRQASMVLDSAYAMRVFPGTQHINLNALCGIMNSRFVALWLHENGIVLRGGYLRMKTAYLRDMPLPGDLTALARVSELVSSGADAEEIEDRVRVAYGLSRWEVLER